LSLYVSRKSITFRALISDVLSVENKRELYSLAPPGNPKPTTKFHFTEDTEVQDRGSFNVHEISEYTAPSV
jgi:hypothetical protein